MAGTFRELRRLMLEKRTEQVHEAANIKIGPFHKKQPRDRTNIQP